MKTPEEIKKGLECCAQNKPYPCSGCPYERDEQQENAWRCDLDADALAYINELEEREWQLFDLLSSAWFTKACYFKQEDGTVYSRVSGEYMTFEQAIDEFVHELTDEARVPLQPRRRDDMNNDLISRKALLKEISTKTMMYDGSCIKKGIGVLLDKWEVLDRIQAAHAVDAEPVRHGRWIKLVYDSKWAKCSECGCNWEWEMIENCNIDFCPNCGAKMDLEVQDGKNNEE